MYGIQHVKQFSFLYQILGDEILGIFLIADNAEAIQTNSVRAFYSSLQTDFFIPCVTAIMKNDHNMNDHKQDVDEQNRHENYALIDMDSLETVSTIFIQWCEIVNNFNLLENK